MGTFSRQAYASMKAILIMAFLVAMLSACKKENSVKPLADEKLVHAQKDSQSAKTAVLFESYGLFQSIIPRGNILQTYQLSDPEGAYPMTPFYIPSIRDYFGNYPQWGDSRLVYVNLIPNDANYLVLRNPSYPNDVRIVNIPAPATGNEVLFCGLSNVEPLPPAPTGTGFNAKYKFYTSNPKHIGYKLTTSLWSGPYHGSVLVSDNVMACPWIYAPAGYIGQYYFALLRPDGTIDANRENVEVNVQSTGEFYVDIH